VHEQDPFCGGGRAGLLRQAEPDRRDDGPAAGPQRGTAGPPVGNCRRFARSSHRPSLLPVHGGKYGPSFQPGGMAFAVVARSSTLRRTSAMCSRSV